MIPAKFRVPWISYWRRIVRPLTLSRAQHGRRARGGNKPPIRGWRCSDHDPPPPPPPLSANVVRHPVPQTLHNFGRIRKLSPICYTTLLGSNKPGNKKSSPWISYFRGNTGNKKSSPWISFFLGCGREQNPGNKTSSPWISYFLGFGREQNKANKKSSPWIYFLGFGREQNTGNKKSSPLISYFLCFWSKSISNLNPPPIASETLADLLQEC